MRSFDRSVARIGVLADPVRRRLYRLVCSQALPVSRDQAAQAVGIARHKAKFHLDRLEAEGPRGRLCAAHRARRSGAGRPAKRYRRGRGEFAVSLPARDYELAARIMADAISYAARTAVPIIDAVRDAAAGHGAAIVATTSDRPSSADGALELAGRILNDHGYEPRRVITPS